MRAKCLKMLISHLSIDSLCTNGALFSKGTPVQTFSKGLKMLECNYNYVRKGDQGNGFGMPAKKSTFFVKLQLLSTIHPLGNKNAINISMLECCAARQQHIPHQCNFGCNKSNLLRLRNKKCNPAFGCTRFGKG